MTESVNDRIRKAVTAPLRSKVSTSDIVATLSSTKMMEVNQDIQEIIIDETKKDLANFVRSLINGNCSYLMCDTCAGNSGNQWGGQMMTQWNCRRCHGSHVSGSTAHEVLCIDCAITSHKCMWCNHNENRVALLLKSK